MYWCNAFLSLLQSYSIIIIIFILVFSSTEAITNKVWLNDIQSHSEKVQGYKSDDKRIETYSPNEKFTLFFDTHKKTLPFDLAAVNEISSPTRKTITQVTTVNYTSVPIVGGGLLNEPNYDTNNVQTSLEDNDQVESFFRVNDDQLSKELVNLAVTIDGSGDTTESTSETTVTTEKPITTTISGSNSTLITTSTTPPFNTSSTTAPLIQILSEYSTFLITVNCTNPNATLNEILKKFSEQFTHSHRVYNSSVPPCTRSWTIDLSITFITNNSVAILNDLFKTLADVVSNMGYTLESVGECGTNEKVPVKDVTSCFLIDLCSLCGTNPPRGVCLPANNVSKCECFVNQNDPSISYAGEFCLPQKTEPITSTSPRWMPIVIGILSGIAALFCVITCSLLIMHYLHHRRSRRQVTSVQDEAETHHVWHLPRVQLPISGTVGNIRTISTSSNDRTNSEQNQSDVTDSTRFQQNYHQIDEHLNPTLTKLNANAPSDTVSIMSDFDEIIYLDAIIDHEYSTDPFADFSEDDEISDATNTRFKLRRVYIDSP